MHLHRAHFALAFNYLWVQEVMTTEDRIVKSVLRSECKCYRILRPRRRKIVPIPAFLRHFERRDVRHDVASKKAAGKGRLQVNFVHQQILSDSGVR
jgi:hypothetical protein